jgi:hypothetical protein
MKKINENEIRGMVKRAIRRVLSESLVPRSFERRNDYGDVPFGEEPGTNVYAQVQDKCTEAIELLKAAQRIQQSQAMGQDEDLQMLIDDIYAYVDAIDPMVR